MASPKPRSVAQSEPRGIDTRARLIRAGTRLFAEHGFDAVSTRQLAAAAEVNLAAVAYHFGGMRELYSCVIGQVVDETEPFFRPVLQSLQSGISAAANDPPALSALCANLVDGLLRGILGDEGMGWRTALVMREYAHPTKAFDDLFARRIEPMHKTISALVGAALNLPADSTEATLRAHAVMGQIVIFGLARVVLLARLDVSSYREVDLPMVIDTVTRSVQSSLDLPPTKRSQAHD